MSKISNLLEIIMIIQYKGLTTASELAQTLGVDKKTVYRYISSLNKANVPVYTKKGRYGGFYIDKNFYMKSANLSARELSALLMASEVLTKQNGFIYEKELKNAVYKIKSVSINSDINLSEMDDTGGFSIDSIGNLKKLEDKISQISYSMSKGKSLNVNYFSVNKNNLTMRKVDPYDLVFKQGNWYVVGYCHMKDDIEIFKLDRIKSLKISDDIYMRPHTFSLKDYLNQHWGVFMGDKIKVLIKFSRNISHFIKSTKWNTNQRIDDLEDGSIILSLYIDDIEDVKKWVMGFGKDAEIIEPEELRKNIKLELEELYKKY
ncbi:YafY family transcriptional regulator [Clostridium sp. WLY-B-L2]|uniref:YafY family transcriptional regulator n=1 Tax=Clostridium aromativorans TaxID=2836848 RepID=A0ABS8N0Q5_9CLOT|nr:YafY family protein [Clostridium aromativorans]MCC9293381.1 YafY family transcriptional regulator [Clostridium aromativorans]